ncbi:hypothetical protein PanWU01x14_352440 [Parasponia andersonii]|uniref:Uncharacterized protein n=1 Tax=Parasponia andersonii TaxID=3476 RepID=A0A2P5AA98_PARAD|nr:hypothetical protein PanWU01x14_352440 [Parasponia andersonii]
MNRKQIKNIVTPYAYGLQNCSRNPHSRVLHQAMGMEACMRLIWVEAEFNYHIVSPYTYGLQNCSRNPPSRVLHQAMGMEACMRLIWVCDYGDYEKKEKLLC